MGFDDKARLVAFARLLGVTGTDEEIFDKYWDYYQNALTTFKKSVTPEPPEIFKRPF